MGVGGNLKLFIVTKSSELLIAEILKTRPADRLVMAPPQMSEMFMNIGVQIIPLITKGTSTEERDKAFAQVAMPGVLEDKTFATTQLPVHSVLGIDRLRFWFYPHTDIRHVLDMIKFDELVVSFDLHSPLVWLAVEHIGKATVVKVSSVLDRQHLDFLKWYDKIHTLIVSYDSEKQFFLKQKIKAKKIISAGLEVPERPRDEKLRDVIGMYYDSRYDWKFLVMLQSLDLGDKKLVIGFRDNVEWEKFLTTFPRLNHPKIELQDFVGITRCAEVLLPAYDEQLVRQFPKNVKITYYDIANTEKASLFSGVL